MRNRAWRRHKDYTKAKRKRDIDLHCNWWPSPINDFFNNEFKSTYWAGSYKYLHQYSKNKIHCSCPICSAKTRNKGKRKKNKVFSPSINYNMMDKRRQMAMDYDENNYDN